MMGLSFTLVSSQPPFVDGVVYTYCQFAVLLNEVMKYNNEVQNDHGSPADLHRRTELYGKLEALEKSLPPALCHDSNFTPQTCFLR